MYPEFLAKAKKDKIANAVETFKFAKAAEAVHAGWYKKALAKLDSWKGSNVVFYVCPRCGDVFDFIPGPACPICMEDSREFMKIT
jgi:rubrerythrin